MRASLRFCYGAEHVIVKMILCFFPMTMFSLPNAKKCKNGENEKVKFAILCSSIRHAKLAVINEQSHL